MWCGVKQKKREYVRKGKRETKRKKKGHSKIKFLCRPCKNSCSACSAFFFSLNSQFFYSILYLVMLCENTILISFYRTLIIECLVFVALALFWEILLHAAYLFSFHTLLVSHLCNFSLITIELTSCYMCAITYDYCP